MRDGRDVALLLDGHGWPVRAVARSLGSRGWLVVAPAGTKTARSRHCAARFRLPGYKRDAGAFADAVAAAIRHFGADVVVPAEDASLELLHETDGLLGGARVLGGSPATIAWVCDKAETLARAHAAGFAATEYVAPGSVAEAVAAGGRFGFPCVVKPRRSYARAGAGLRSERLRFAGSPAELRATVARFVEKGFDLPLVQRFTPGRSFGVSAVVREGRLLAWGAVERFSQYPLRGGSAVWRRTVGAEAPGVRDALELFGALGFEGFGDVQYHVDAGGTPRLMEMGARIHGWVPLAMLAGVDFPWIAVQALRGVEPPETVVARPGLEMRWPLGELARVVEAATPWAELPPGKRRRDVLRDLWPLWGPSMHYDGIGLDDGPPLRDLLPGGGRRPRRR